jgi:hypothetical protein
MALASLRRLSAGVTVAGVLALARVASADPEKAELLFRQGRTALERGQLTQACGLLARSYEEDPTSGTLLNLAYCHRATGKYWKAYREFGDVAAQATSSERRDFATKSMKGLEQVLPRVELQLEKDVARVERDDGSIVDDPHHAFPVEPGHHTLTLVMSSGERRALAIEVPDRRGVALVIVVPQDGVAAAPPIVRDSGPREPAPPPQAELPSAERRSAPSAESPPASSLRRPVGWAALATSGVGITLGSYFGLRSFAIRDDACVSKACDQGGLDRIHGSATTTAVASTVAFGVGAVGLLTGIYLLVTAGPAPSAPRRADP